MSPYVFGRGFHCLYQFPYLSSDITAATLQAAPDRCRVEAVAIAYCCCMYVCGVDCKVIHFTDEQALSCFMSRHSCIPSASHVEICTTQACTLKMPLSCSLGHCCSQSIVKSWAYFKTYKTNSVAWIRERAIPNERQPLVGEVSANFCG
jgi:hypothetical protein